jgi:hypothetical protein
MIVMLTLVTLTDRAADFVLTVLRATDARLGAMLLLAIVSTDGVVRDTGASGSAKAGAQLPSRQIENQMRRRMSASKKFSKDTDGLKRYYLNRARQLSAQIIKLVAVRRARNPDSDR